MLRRLAHPQATKQFARSFQNISLHRLGHQPLSNRLYPPTVFGVTRLSQQGRYLNVVGLAHGVWGGQVAGFHSTRRNEGLPVVPFFAAVLKASGSLELARIAGRVALSLAPFLFLKNRKSMKWLQKDLPGMEEKRPLVLRGIRTRTILFHILILTPVLLFWATIIASLERTPLTGRWRLILLSPEEEDQIAAQLAGEGWYNAVSEILLSQAEDGKVPTPIPTTDWRYQWVQTTLRRLESVVPTLQDETKHSPSWLETGLDDIQFPPPADHPLRPRPRASEYLKMFSDMTCGKQLKHTPDHAPHTITGPPYSLLLVDNPNSSNAFSYGFGPDGGGGIVVYSAFIDEILNDPSLAFSTTSSEPEETSWWSYLFGSILNTKQPHNPVPSPEQTNRLAVLLAHELSHLILSHHLESLTSSSIVLPGLLSILTDLLRTLMFPVTMLFGPFVNDAVANMGKIGSGEVTKLSVLCTTRLQELEADVVSTRLLAYAGFDPHSTITFWESRTPTVYGSVSECATWKEDAKDAREAEGDALSRKSAFSLFGSTHPLNDTRVGALADELLRWSTEKEEALTRLQAEIQSEEKEAGGV